MIINNTKNLKKFKLDQDSDLIPWFTQPNCNNHKSHELSNVINVSHMRLQVSFTIRMFDCCHGQCRGFASMDLASMILLVWIWLVWNRKLLGELAVVYIKIEQCQSNILYILLYKIHSFLYFILYFILYYTILYAVMFSIPYCVLHSVLNRVITYRYDKHAFKHISASKMRFC